MKKIYSIFVISIICLSSVFATGFKPSLHTTPSVRQQGFGGFYSTDVNNAYSFFANPASLGLRQKHAIFPTLQIGLAGPLSDMDSVYNAINNQDTGALGKYINKYNGIHIGANASPLLTFGGTTAAGFGWSVETQMFADASIPSVSISDINLGLEAIARFGFGFPIINLDNLKLSVGATAKGFVQIASTYTGSLLDFVNMLDNNAGSLPAYFSVGYGLDAGAYFSLCNRLKVGLVCTDLFTRAHTAASTFDNISTSFNQSSILDPKVSLGVGYSFPVEWALGVITSLQVMGEYKNMLNLFNPPLRNPILDFACGAEVTLFNIVSLRLGIIEMYPSFGIGASFGSFKIDFATYGRELGLEPGSTPCLNAAFSIGFNY